jgi:hypothetical protein
VRAPVDLLGGAPEPGRQPARERAPAAYWIARLAERGFRLSPLDDAFRAEVAPLALGPWYKDNVHAFEMRVERPARPAPDGVSA